MRCPEGQSDMLGCDYPTCEECFKAAGVEYEDGTMLLAARRFTAALQALGRALLDSLAPAVRATAKALTALDAKLGECTCGVPEGMIHHRWCRGWLWHKVKHPGPDPYKRHLARIGRDFERRRLEEGFTPIRAGVWPNRRIIGWVKHMGNNDRWGRC